MKILIACRAIDNIAGGVERQATMLMNEMVKRGHQVGLYTLDPEDAVSFYPMDPSIKWFKRRTGDPQKKATLRTKIIRMIKLRKVVRAFSPDVILAFQHGTFLSTKAYSFGLGIPTISAERESPYRFEHLSAGKHRWLWMHSFVFAKHITVQCKSYVAAYPKHSQAKITVIPNPVVQTKLIASPSVEKSSRNILLSVGRLTYQKNQEALLRAFAEISDTNPSWDLKIAGDGEDRHKLELMIHDLKLNNRVTLLGTTNNVQELYLKSNAFCISSRWEGFPNVLGEALSHGLPAVGFKGCGGVPDLITHKKNGLLADGNGDYKTLAQQLDIMLSNSKMRAQLGAEAKKSVESYEPSKIFDYWEQYLEKVYQS